MLLAARIVGRADRLDADELQGDRLVGAGPLPQMPQEIVDIFERQVPVELGFDQVKKLD